MKWLNRGMYMVPDTYPHEEVKIQDFSWIGRCLFAKWTENFDCAEETQFWYIIKDNIFDINSVNAKRRYEIKKGIKHFYVKEIKDLNLVDDVYSVHLESLLGYDKQRVTVPQKDEFDKWTRHSIQRSDCALLGVFDRDDDRLCGYSDCYLRGKYIPISSLKTRVSCEARNVNFALLYGIIEHFAEELSNGCYLCDGTRNVLHETNFQDFLIKYFGFRRAYCELKLRYRGCMKLFIHIIFPFRKALGKLGIRELDSLLRQHAYSKGLSE